MGAGAVGCWREFGEEGGGDYEGYAVAQVSTDQGPAAAEAVDEEDAEELGYQSDDGVDGLVAEGGLAGYADLFVDFDGVVSIIVSDEFWIWDWAGQLTGLPIHRSSARMLGEHSRGTSGGTTIGS